MKDARMSVLREAERILSAMTRAEKAQLLQWVASDLGDAFPGIETTSGICGGEARIVRTAFRSGFWSRPGVWALRRRTCCVAIRRCGPRIWSMPGLMRVRIGRRSNARSGKTKKRRWRACTPTRTFPYLWSRRSGALDTTW